MSDQFRNAKNNLQESEPQNSQQHNDQQNSQEQSEQQNNQHRQELKNSQNYPSHQVIVCFSVLNFFPIFIRFDQACLFPLKL